MMIFFKKFQDFIIEQPLNEIFSFLIPMFLKCCSSNKIKSMLPSHKIKMAVYYVKHKKYFRRHLGLSRHFDFLAWKQCFYFYIALELQHIKK
jgi:hypothetical protein